MRYRLCWLLLALVISAAPCAAQERTATQGDQVLRAGAAAVNISPSQFPAVVNCMFTERSSERNSDPLHARALVLDDGDTRIAIVIVDSCMMPRELIDQAKVLASRATGIPAEQMLIAATHTHSAPAAMGCLGSDPDPQYIQFLIPQLARSIEQAVQNLEPARIGWGVTEAPDQTHCRRWILRSDRMRNDPFGERTVRAHMHPGHQNPDFIGPSGPTDPELSILSVQSRDGRPICVLANYSMHYFGSQPISADYFGVFAEQISRELKAENSDPAFVGIMSQGTSGDQQWMDYSQPAARIGINEYTQELVDRAVKVYEQIEYRTWVPVAMREAKLTLTRRVADEERLAWARPVVEQLAGRDPTSQPEIYAREQVLIAQDPQRELKLQAIRVGDVGIAAWPNEVYAISGLKIKEQSPLPMNFNIELANGAEGYIPPPEQHRLGGYTTWAARTAGLEVEAEPKIVETLLTLLEKVAEQPRRPIVTARSPYVDAALASKPLAYWRLDEMAGRVAHDLSGNDRHGEYDGGLALYLPGATGEGLSAKDQLNRAVHFAGGRVKLPNQSLGQQYSVELWLYNGFPAEDRPVAGYAFSHGPDGDREARGDHLGINGTHATPGRLLFFNGNQLDETIHGESEVPLKTWNHVVLVRDGETVQLYLNGKLDGTGKAKAGLSSESHPIFIGGRSDNFANFEGKIDEVALYGRALTAEEVAKHFHAARSSAAEKAGATDESR